MWERWGKLLTRHEGKVSPLFLQLVVARAVPANIGPRPFLYGPSAARSVVPRPRANIPQYGPRTRLLRSYYSPKAK